MKKALIAAVKRYPVFSVREIGDVLGKGRSYAYLAAYRAKKAGVIQEIEKGKYTLEEDPFLIASWIVWPSYISGWAALHYHKMTEQLPFTIHVATTRKRKRKRIHFGGAKIEFIRIKKEALCGFHRVSYRDKEVFIAEKEKAIVDGIAARKISFAEAADLVRQNRKKISSRRLLSYAKAVRGLVKRLKGVLNDKER